MSAPPAFANADACHICTAKFTLFNRRHHCRNCGISLCSTCCPYKDPLPHFGLTSPERTCSDCHDYLTAAPSASPVAIAAAAAAAGTAPVPSASSAAAAAPAPTASAPPSTTSGAGSRPFAGFAPAPRSGGPGKFQSFSAMSGSAAGKTPTAAASPAGTAGAAERYKVGAGADLEEQCREAIKAGDTDGVAYLLKNNADPNYRDRTGNTLLHVACIMDRFSIVELLCEAGGNPYVKNALTAAETAADVAPRSLRFKIKTRWPESNFA